MSFAKNLNLPIAQYVVIATTLTPVFVGGVLQTFSVPGALTSDWVEAQIVGDGTALTLTSLGARVSTTDTVELTLGAALNLTVRVWIWRAT